MLRLIVLVLVLLNGVYFAWSQGFLAGLGFAPAQESEPQRLAQQVRPETLHLLTGNELRMAEAEPRPNGKPGECLQAGLFNADESAAVRAALEASWPVGSWALEDATVPARWIVYMGKYASTEDLAKKRAQLAALNLKFEPLNNPALGPGLSLGGFDTQDAANAALEAFARRGVRTARVVQERGEVPGMQLRLPQVNDALRARLVELKPALAGKPLTACQ
jgi:hypothetical protein